MTRRILVVGLLVALLLLGTGLPGSAPPAPAAYAADDPPPAERVLIMSLPTVGWELVAEVSPPVLHRLLSRAAVASLSVRTIGPITTSGEGYVSIGAGNRATVEDSVAGLAFPPDAAFEGDEARQVFERRCGCRAGDAAVLHLGMPRVIRSNDRLLYEAEPGSLGQALADAGRRAAVVANADQSLSASGDDIHREAALAVIDGDGRVASGTVGPQLLLEDPKAPYGVRTDLAQAEGAIRAAWDDADVLLVEASDLDRVDRYAAVSSPEATEEAAADALLAADELLAAALDGVDLERDLVIVVAPLSRRGGPAELTVAAFVGRGFEPGLARSAATRRDGYVTLPDIAPTVLEALGIERPAAMTGTLASSAGGPSPDAGLFRALADDNERTTFRDEATGPTSVAFIVFLVLTCALAVLALTTLPRLRSWVAFMALITLAQPPLAFLSGLVRHDGLGVVGFIVALFAGGAVLAGAALGVSAVAAPWSGRARPLVAPLVLVAFSLAVLLADVVAGSPLQLDTVFGYSPTVAGRFAGWGNLAFALVAMTTLVLVTGLWGVASLRRERREPARRGPALVAAAIAFAVVVAADGHPAFGSDVGGVLATIPAFTVTLIVLSRRRVSPRLLALVAVATVAVISLFAALDLARPEESRTHLGRAADRVLSGGDIGTIIARKVSANISILTSSVWTWVIPVAFGFLAFLLWRGQGFIRELQEHVPGLRACLIGAIVVALLGFALNDSGVAVPAMMLGVLLPYLTFLVVRTSEL